MKFEIYAAKDGYRWTLVAKNGETVADSGEAYTRRADARRAAKLVKGAVSGARVIDLPGEIETAKSNRSFIGQPKAD